MKLAPLKYLCVDSGQYGLNVAASDYRDVGVPLIRTSDITDGAVRGEAPLVDRPVDPRFFLKQGDLLVSRAGSVGESHSVAPDQENSTFAGYLIRFRPDCRVSDPRYLYYLSKSHHFVKAIEAGSVVSTIANFNAERYANINVPILPLAEQRRIADFLDDQVARIDNIIAARQRQRELLQAEITSSADHVLTRRDWQTTTRFGRFVTQIEQGWSPQCESPRVSCRSYAGCFHRLMVA